MTQAGKRTRRIFDPATPPPRHAERRGRRRGVAATTIIMS